MAQINFRIDDETKRKAEELFSGLGLTMSSAITVFLCQSINEQGIPFAVQRRNTSVRPISDLLRRIDDVEHGQNCHYHDLIEDAGGNAPKLVKPRRTATRGRKVYA